jgi:hypothetical protein
MPTPSSLSHLSRISLASLAHAEYYQEPLVFDGTPPRSRDKYVSRLSTSYKFDHPDRSDDARPPSWLKQWEKYDWAN